MKVKKKRKRRRQRRLRKLGKWPNMHLLLLEKCLGVVILQKEFLKKVKLLWLNTTFLMNFGIWAPERFLKVSKSKLISKRKVQTLRKKKKSKKKIKKKKRKK